jgi:hypothetical protein
MARHLLWRSEGDLFNPAAFGAFTNSCQSTAPLTNANVQCTNKQAIVDQRQQPSCSSSATHHIQAPSQCDLYCPCSSPHRKAWAACTGSLNSSPHKLTDTPHGTELRHCIQLILVLFFCQRKALLLQVFPHDVQVCAARPLHDAHIIRLSPFVIDKLPQLLSATTMISCYISWYGDMIIAPDLKKLQE